MHFIFWLNLRYIMLWIRSYFSLFSKVNPILKKLVIITSPHTPTIYPLIILIFLSVITDSLFVISLIYSFTIWFFPISVFFSPIYAHNIYLIRLHIFQSPSVFLIQSIIHFKHVVYVSNKYKQKKKIELERWHGP